MYLTHSEIQQLDLLKGKRPSDSILTNGSIDWSAKLKPSKQDLDINILILMMRSWSDV